MSNGSSSNSSTEDEQFVSRITPMTIQGPILVVSNTVAVATAQRYTVDVLFHHSSYISASRSVASLSKHVLLIFNK